MSATVRKKLVVIGGGAAGIFCAVTAARLNKELEVIVVEKTSKLLQKVKISGGGRCNLTHACFDIDEMSGRYPRGKNFVKKAFYQFFTTDTIKWFEDRGVPSKTEPDGRMFPKANTSQAVIDCLMNEILQYKIVVYHNYAIEAILHAENGFQLQSPNKPVIDCDYVMLACGGQYKMEQFKWLSNLELPVVNPVPSLFTFNFPGHPLKQLTGISVPSVSIKITGFKHLVNAPLLITHWGVSGPAVLRLSAFAAVFLAEVNYQYEVVINWSNHWNEPAFLQKLQQVKAQSPAQKVTNGNFTELPSRLWQFLISASEIAEEKRWADISNKEINKLAASICQYRIKANGKTTYKDEFVTAGGIDLSAIDANTMMSKKYSGLYFGGEIMNVDGITGGYNFQHAWTSGFIAGTHIAKQAAL